MVERGAGVTAKVLFQAAATLLLLRAWVRFVKPPLCLDYGGYGPYEDADGFGYKDWVCELPRGHRGDHFSRA